MISAINQRRLLKFFGEVGKEIPHDQHGEWQHERGIDDDQAQVSVVKI
jgi:hypothetical protein